jgi:hypothetical protein
MKNKIVKKMMAAIAAAALITATSVPALANETADRVSGLGVPYTVDYTQGAANIDGIRCYFGFTAETPRVKAIGWRESVELRAAELADLSAIDSTWWAWYIAGRPTVEQWRSWTK